mgnify:FL=1
MSNFLTIELDAERVEIVRAGGGWEVAIHLDAYEKPLTFWTDEPDRMYDQLVEMGEIER